MGKIGAVALLCGLTALLAGCAIPGTTTVVENYECSIDPALLADPEIRGEELVERAEAGKPVDGQAVGEAVRANTDELRRIRAAHERARETLKRKGCPSGQ